jgi:hypothetical protein
LNGALEFPKPNVTLFRSGGIEDPCVVLANELTKSSGVAMKLTESVPFFVLALEVPHVNRITNIVKVVIP